MTHRPRRATRVARRASVGAVLLALAVPALPAGAAETTNLADGVTSTTGAAIAYSETTFAGGSAPTVLLARNDDFADALTSGPAQGLLQAPLLLTDPTVLSPEVMAELMRLGAEDVIIMGGEEAVSPAVEAQLSAFTVSRLEGATRIETSVAVADALFPNATNAVVARGFPTSDPSQAFADAIPAGTYGAGAGVPVLLTETAMLSSSVETYITASFIEDAIIAGGTAAISQAVEDSLEDIDISDLGADDPEASESASFTVTRAAGATRGGTATALAAELGHPSAAGSPRVILLESREADAWAAGLTAGAQAGNGAAVVLSDGPNLFEETVTFLGTGADVPLLCGPLVDLSACAAAATALGNDAP